MGVRLPGIIKGRMAVFNQTTPNANESPVMHHHLMHDRNQSPMDYWPVFNLVQTRFLTREILGGITFMVKSPFMVSSEG